MMDDRDMEVKTTHDTKKDTLVLEFKKMKNNLPSDYIFYLRDQLTLHKSFTISIIMAVTELNQMRHMP